MSVPMLSMLCMCISVTGWHNQSRQKRPPTLHPWWRITSVHSNMGEMRDHWCLRRICVDVHTNCNQRVWQLKATCPDMWEHKLNECVQWESESAWVSHFIWVLWSNRTWTEHLQRNCRKINRLTECCVSLPINTRHLTWAREAWLKLM